MPEDPLISIVLPNLNGAKYLAGAVESFLEQDYPRKELIVVDGRSTDDSHRILQEFASAHEDVRWVRKVDRSQAEAANLGIDHSRGSIVGYLGSDDRLYRGILAEVAGAARWCDYDAVYFNSYTYRIRENDCRLRRCPEVEFTRDNLLRLGTLVGLQNIFFRRRVFERHRFDEENRWCLDYEFYLKITSERYLFLFLDRVATINLFDGNMSEDRDGKQFDECCRVAARYRGDYRGPVYFSDANRPGKSGWGRRIRGRLKRWIRGILDS